MQTWLNFEIDGTKTWRSSINEDVNDPRRERKMAGFSTAKNSMGLRAANAKVEIQALGFWSIETIPQIWTEFGWPND